ncbi:SdpI family protein [Pontibacter akesuensis]|nr:SdpI family protein [Pontibacter akesuensis]
MLLLHLLPGLLLFIAGIIFRTWPPKQINWLYGFRTHYSMRDQPNWDEANRYHPTLLIGIGMIATLAGGLSYLFVPPKLGILLVVALMLVLLMGSIVLTNEHLKRKYGKW